MKLTKYEHACFVVELGGVALIVDPGDYTTDLIVPDDIVGIVVTHEHADHLGIDNITAIAAENPDVVIIGHQAVTSKLPQFRTQTVVQNEGIKIGPFELEFFGGEHATIDPSMTTIANLGVMINNRIYYPGDSFALPDRAVELLALPVSAPWMKISEAAAFANAVQPVKIFPTHDAILSETGMALVDKLIPSLTQQSGAAYERITETIDI